MINKTNIPFLAFIEYFPETTLPVTLTDESIFDYNKINKPFPEAVVQAYLVPLEGEEYDEFTEFTPCFSIPDTHDFLAIVYWKAGLLNHQYILATFTKKAELIDKKVIAGTFSDNEVLIQAVATIDEDWEIIIVSGQQPAKEQFRFDASKSTTKQFEILPEGKIIAID